MPRPGSKSNTMSTLCHICLPSIDHCSYSSHFTCKREVSLAPLTRCLQLESVRVRKQYVYKT